MENLNPNSNSYKKITFALPGESTIVEVISGILKTCGLEETPIEYLKKSSEGKPTRLIVVRDAAISLAEKKILEKDLAALLEKQLETSEETAKKVIDEIKKYLIPSAKMITFGEEKMETIATEDLIKQSNVPPKMKAPIEVEKILAEKQEPPFKEKREEAPIKKAPAKGPDAPRKTERPAPRQPRKPDSYREPIE